nr:hypothetical protein [uncultured Butyricicoccus sp.]
MKRLVAGACVAGLLIGSAGAVVSEMTPPPVEEVMPEGTPSVDYKASADVLYQLGLFQGSGTDRFGQPVYELELPCTRAEAAVMLVRLLGLEEEAKNASATPFVDLQDWQAPYVNLLYHRGMVKGASYDRFEPESPCTAQMYTALMLRALGYSDQQGDFTYDNAILKAMQIGLIDSFSCDVEDFRRDDAAQMSRMALELTPKGSNITLLDKLVDDGIVDADKAQMVEQESRQVVSLREQIQMAQPYEADVFGALLDNVSGNSISLHGTLTEEGKRARLDGVLSVALADGHSVSQQVIVLRDSSGISLSPLKSEGYRDDQIAALLRQTNFLSVVMSAVPARSLITDVRLNGEGYEMPLLNGTAALTVNQTGVPQTRTLDMTLHDMMYSVTAQTTRSDSELRISVPDGYSSYIKISNTPG